MQLCGIHVSCEKKQQHHIQNMQEHLAHILVMHFLCRNFNVKRILRFL